MKTLFRSSWFMRTAALLLVLLVAIMSLNMIEMKTHQAHATGVPPLYLVDIGVWNTSFRVQPAYHRGQAILLDADFQNETGQSITFTAHPVVYHNSYRLLNIAIDYTSTTYYYQEPHWMVTVPKKAPTGTYNYWFTLIQPSFPNQALMITFNIVK